MATPGTVFPSLLPGPIRADFVAPALLDASATVHTPSPTTFSYVSMDLIDNSAVVYEPTVERGAVTVAVPHLESATLVYEPTLTATATVVVPPIAAATTVHEPSLDTTIDVPIPWLDASVTVLEPSVASLATVLPDTIVVGTTVHEPSLSSSATVEMPLLLAGPSHTLDFSDLAVVPVVGQDEGTYAILDSGATVRIIDNAWKMVEQPFTITADTVLEFDFDSDTVVGEPDIVGIGIGKGNVSSYSTYCFQLIGWQTYGIQDYNDVWTSGDGPTRFVIPVGEHYTGSDFTEIFFIRDDDDPLVAGGTEFSNIAISSGMFPPTLDTTIDAPIPLLDAAPALYEPTLTTTFDVVVPEIPSETAVYAPNVQAVVVVPLLDAAATLHEPTRTSTVSVYVPFIPAGTTVYEPGTATTATVLVPLLDAAPTFHLPTLVSTVHVPLLDATAVLHEPVVVREGIVEPFLYDASPTIHEPTLLPQPVSVTVPLLVNGLTVHEPASQAISPVLTPVISVGIVYEPVVDATAWVAVPPLDAAPTFYEPTLEATATVLVPLLDAAATLHGPATAITVEVPLLQVSPTVYEPVAEATAFIVPEIIPVGTVYAPGTVSTVHVPLLDASATISQPTVAAVAYIGQKYFYTDGTAGNSLYQRQENQLLADDAHFQQSKGGWAYGTLIYHVQSQEVTPHFGDYVLRMEVNSNSPNPGASIAYTQLPKTNAVTCVAGDVIRTVGYGACDPVTSGDQYEGVIGGVFYDSSDNVLQYTSATKAALPMDGSVGKMNVATATAPANTAYFRPRFTAIKIDKETSHSYEVGDVIYLDAVTVSVDREITDFVPSHKVTGVIDMEAKLKNSDWTGSTYQAIYYQWSSNRGPVFYINAAGSFWIAHGDGTSDHTGVSTPAPLVDGETHTVRATMDPATGDYQYYVDGHNFDSDTLTAPWTPTGPPNTRHAYINGTTSGFPVNEGNMYWFHLRDGIGGPIVLSMHADDVPYNTGQLTTNDTWLDPLGGTWTVQAAGTYTYNTIDCIDASPTIYEPAVDAVAFIAPGTIESNTVVHEPAAIATFDVDVPTILNPATVHEPALSTIAYIQLDILDASVTVHEFLITGIYSWVYPETLNAAPTIHEPALDVSYTIAPSSISAGGVYPPAVSSSYVVSVPTISSTVAVYAPELAQVAHIPTLDATATVYEPVAYNTYLVETPTIYNATLVYEPVAHQIVRIETLDASPTIHEPVVHSTVSTQFPTIGPDTVVHQPTLDIQAVIAPATIPVGFLHPPTITTGEVYVTVPHIPSGTLVHTIGVSELIHIPHIVGTTMVYGPAITLEAPLEIVGFRLGIAQNFGANLGIAPDMDRSVLVRN